MKTIVVKISIEFKGKIEIEAHPYLNDWNDADEDSKLEYVNNFAKEYILENIEELNDLAKIDYQK